MQQPIRTRLSKFFSNPSSFIWAAFGAVGMSVLVGIVFLFIVLSGRSIVPPLVKVAPTEVVMIDPVCPGQEIISDVRLTSSRPTVLEIDSAIFSLEEKRIVLGTERSLSSPVPQSFTELPLSIRFIVPSGQKAGNYQTVFAITPKGRSYELALVNVWFTLKETCD